MKSWPVLLLAALALLGPTLAAAVIRAICK